MVAVIAPDPPRPTTDGVGPAPSWAMAVLLAAPAGVRRVAVWAAALPPRAMRWLERYAGDVR